MKFKYKEAKDQLIIEVATAEDSQDFNFFKEPIAQQFKDEKEIAEIGNFTWSVDLANFGKVHRVKIDNASKIMGEVLDSLFKAQLQFITILDQQYGQPASQIVAPEGYALSSNTEGRIFLPNEGEKLAISKSTTFQS
jgi:hypothetical protein